MPSTTPSTAPSASLMSPILQMSTLIKLKMENLSTRSANENRTLNAQIKQLYDTMSANPAINAFIESQDGHEHWIRFASLIEGWLGCESNVAQQSIEMAELFKEVMASKGIDMGVKDGQLKVQGKTEVARGMAEWMGFDAEGRCNRGCDSTAPCRHEH